MMVTLGWDRDRASLRLIETCSSRPLSLILKGKLLAPCSVYLDLLVSLAALLRLD